MAGYLGATPVPQATQHRESFTATAAQTTFATAGYTVGFLDVYLNGVHLTPADVTATNGSDVVLGACLVNDIVDVISHSAFELNAQTFTGTTTMDVVTATGVVTANGGAVFNEGSADVDFRVESNGNANMLFVDGGSDHVNIGTATDLGAVLNVLSPSNARGIILQNVAANSASQITFKSNGGNEDSFIRNQANDTGQDILTLGTAGATGLNINAIGAVTKPLQPAFLVQPASQQDNIAINSDVTVVFGTERFDQNADFASNTFTAPVTGKYQLGASLYFLNLDIDVDYYECYIVTSNRTYHVSVIQPDFTSDVAYITFGNNVLADMDASDTAFVRIRQSGGGAQTDIRVTSYFCGYLVA